MSLKRPTGSSYCRSTQPSSLTLRGSVSRFRWGREVHRKNATDSFVNPALPILRVRRQPEKQFHGPPVR